MKETRRNFLAGMATAMAFGPGALMPARAAETYPSRAIKVVLPFATGGQSDTVARLVVERMSAALGQPMVVENTSGAGGMIAAAAVARAAPDGYTLFLANASTLTITPHFQKGSAARQPAFTPITTVSAFPLVLVVPSSSPYKSLKELVAAAKANPGKLSFATPGQGTTPHLVTEILKREAGIELTHVPYKGGAPALNDLLGGQVDMFFEAPSTLLPHVESGKLRALAVTGKARMSALPGVPTVAEIGMPELTLESWSAFVAPPQTPAAIVARLHEEAMKALKNDEIIAKLRARGFEAAPSSPDELSKMIREESRKWGQLIKERNISAE
jgi:tripartite-type tricarboxylate transporter receptor subunit TctC